MSSAHLAQGPEGAPCSCDWDLLSDDVVTYDILLKIPAPTEPNEESQEPNKECQVPFHPRLVLQCARKGLFVWSPDRLTKLLSLKPVGPLIQEIQETLRSKFEGSIQTIDFRKPISPSGPKLVKRPQTIDNGVPQAIFTCNKLKRLDVIIPEFDTLQSLPGLAASLEDLKLRLDTNAKYRSTHSKLTDNVAALTRLTSLLLSVKESALKGYPLDFAFLNHLSGLRTLTLGFTDGLSFLDVDFSTLRPLPALESLTLDNWTVTPAVLEAFDRAPRLSELRFISCGLDDNPLSRLSTLTTLARLRGLDEAPGIPPPNVLKSLNCVYMSAPPPWLSQCMALQEFRGGCTAAADLARFGPLTRLTSLSLGTGDSEISSLAPLSSLRNLQDLWLRGICSMLDYSALSRMTLTRLRLWPGRLKVPFRGFKYIASAGELRHLEVDGIALLDLQEPGFNHLSTLTKLTYLALRRTLVQDEDLPHLRPLTNLRALDLHTTDITNQGIRDTIVHLTALTMLDVYESGVSSEGIRCLTSLRRLKRVNVSDRELDKIRQADPSFMSRVTFDSSYLY